VTPRCARCGAEKRTPDRWSSLICPDGSLLEFCDSDCLLRHRQEAEAAFLARLRRETGVAWAPPASTRGSSGRRPRRSVLIPLGAGRSGDVPIGRRPGSREAL
jgi:hypothetical protein